MIPYGLILIFEMISQFKSLPQAMRDTALFDPDSDISIRFDRSTLPYKPDLGLFITGQLDYSKDPDEALIFAIIDADAEMLIAEHPQLVNEINYMRLLYQADNIDITWR